MDVLPRAAAGCGCAQDRPLIDVTAHTSLKQSSALMEAPPASEVGASDLATVEVLRSASGELSFALSPHGESVNTVTACSPSDAAAGLRVGDRIIAADGVPLAGRDLAAVLAENAEEDRASHRLLVVRKAYDEEALAAALAQWALAASTRAAVHRVRFTGCRLSLLRTRRTLSRAVASWLIWRRQQLHRAHVAILCATIPLMRRRHALTSWRRNIARRLALATSAASMWLHTARRQTLRKLAAYSRRSIAERRRATTSARTRIAAAFGALRSACNACAAAQALSSLARGHAFASAFKTMRRAIAAHIATPMRVSNRAARVAFTVRRMRLRSAWYQLLARSTQLLRISVYVNASVPRFANRRRLVSCTRAWHRWAKDVHVWRTILAPAEASAASHLHRSQNANLHVAFDRLRRARAARLRLVAADDRCKRRLALSALLRWCHAARCMLEVLSRWTSVSKAASSRRLRFAWLVWHAAADQFRLFTLRAAIHSLRQLRSALDHWATTAFANAHAYALIASALDIAMERREASGLRLGWESLRRAHHRGQSPNLRRCVGRWRRGGGEAIRERATRMVWEALALRAVVHWQRLTLNNVLCLWRLLQSEVARSTHLRATAAATLRARALEGAILAMRIWTWRLEVMHGALRRLALRARAERSRLGSAALALRRFRYTHALSAGFTRLRHRRAAVRLQAFARVGSYRRQARGGLRQWSQNALVATSRDIHADGASRRLRKLRLRSGLGTWRGASAERAARAVAPVAHRAAALTRAWRRWGQLCALVRWQLGGEARTRSAWLRYGWARWLRRRHAVANEKRRAVRRIELRRRFKELRQQCTVFAVWRKAMTIATAAEWRADASRVFTSLVRAAACAGQRRMADEHALRRALCCAVLAFVRYVAARLDGAKQAMERRVIGLRASEICSMHRGLRALSMVASDARRAAVNAVVAANHSPRLQLRHALSIWRRRHAQLIDTVRALAALWSTAKRPALQRGFRAFRGRAERRAAAMVIRLEHATLRRTFAKRQFFRRRARPTQRRMAMRALRKWRGVRALCHHVKACRHARELHASAAKHLTPRRVMRIALARLRSMVQSRITFSEQLAAAARYNNSSVAPSTALLRWQLYVLDSLEAVAARRAVIARRKTQRRRRAFVRLRSHMDRENAFETACLKGEGMEERRVHRALNAAMRRFDWLRSQRALADRRRAHQRLCVLRRGLRLVLRAAREHSWLHGHAGAIGVRLLSLKALRLWHHWRRTEGEAEAVLTWRTPLAARTLNMRRQRFAWREWLWAHPRRSRSAMATSALSERAWIEMVGRAALRRWNELAVNSLVSKRTLRCSVGGGALRRWRWATRAASRAARLTGCAQFVYRRAALRHTYRRWRSHAATRGTGWSQLAAEKAVAHAIDTWLRWTLRGVRATWRREAAARCAMRLALTRGCVQLARYGVRRARGDVMSLRASERCTHRAISTWAEAGRRRDRRRSQRFIAVRRERSALDVAERFWRLRSLFRGFASVLSFIAAESVDYSRRMSYQY